MLIAGVGGLGCPAALLIAQAGVGSLTLVDPDRVELSNLHRQPLFDERDLGQPKALVAAQRLQERFPTVAIKGLVAAVEEENIEPLLTGHDLLVDATDRIETKLWLNDECVRLGTPLVHAGALGWQGQLCTVLPGRSACLRCIFAAADDESLRSSCREAGIVGPVVGYVGARQAFEALALLAGEWGQLTADRMLLFDAWRPSLRVVRVRRDPNCAVCAGVLPARGHHTRKNSRACSA